MRSGVASNVTLSEASVLSGTIFFEETDVRSPATKYSTSSFFRSSNRGRRTTATIAAFPSVMSVPRPARDMRRIGGLFNTDSPASIAPWAAIVSSPRAGLSRMSGTTKSDPAPFTVPPFSAATLPLRIRSENRRSLMVARPDAAIIGGMCSRNRTTAC